eukprot:CAMPEP_0178419236 /NCGR_PEP_ID=MMETSP0689_2-20121128/25504_1 /TAXON_ID=160604 /ORGANISM="Amphidinium massartii, Strain CS-259" /LENGTH=99 /DNA_ID=CAMNT_0020040663 /DNA_START=56 /DNA_END=352 /DNA_ORIENTATION=+
MSPEDFAWHTRDHRHRSIDGPQERVIAVGKKSLPTLLKAAVIVPAMDRKETVNTEAPAQQSRDGFYRTCCHVISNADDPSATVAQFEEWNLLCERPNQS